MPSFLPITKHNEGLTMLTPQHHTFIQEYLATGNATQAAITAGYSAKTAQPQASRLLKRDDIKEAIEAAQADIKKQTEVTIADLLDQLEDARQLAIETGKASAAVAAIMGKARLLGYDKPTENVTNVDVKSGLGWFYGDNNLTMSEDEADARIEELTKKLGYTIDQ